jgi:hypothetical protein
MGELLVTTEMLKLYVVAAAFLFPAGAAANNVESYSRIHEGRVQLILTNTLPGTVVTLDRAEVPVSLDRRKGEVRPSRTRVIPLSGIVRDHTVIDLGTVQEVFNGGGVAADAIGIRPEPASSGMTKCQTRSTPVSVRMLLSDGSTIMLRRAVQTEVCSSMLRQVLRATGSAAAPVP